VTAQFRRDGGLAWIREIAVTVPVSASFFEEGAADAPVKVCAVNNPATATKIDRSLNVVNDSINLDIRTPEAMKNVLLRHEHCEV